MIGSNSLLIGYLIAILNMAFFLMAFFMILDVIRYLKMCEMPAAMIIAACAAFVFVAGVPLSSVIEQFLKDPQRSIGEVVLKSVVDMLPMQILLIMIGMSIWAVIKGTSPEKQNGRNER